MKRVVLTTLCFVLSATALGDTVVYKDQFLNASTPGDLAIVAETVESLAATKTLMPLERNTTQTFKRRAKCIVSIAHRDPDHSGLDTFVGIQLIKIFQAHATPGVLHVMRNAGWFSRENGKPLGEERGEVAVRNMADFAAAHSTNTRLDMLTYTNGKTHVATSWHARLGPSGEADDSADEPFVRFWQTDPTVETMFNDAHQDLLKNSPPLRVENRLLRFKLTDSRIPWVCRHSTLIARIRRWSWPRSGSICRSRLMLRGRI